MLSVKAVAYTQIDYQALAETGYIDHWTVNEPTEPDSVIVTGDAVVDGWIDVAPNPAWNEWVKEHIPTEIDELHEFSGRNCYKSWGRPNPETQSNNTYLKKSIIDSGHWSVLAHGHVSFYVSGVSRALLLELERHSKKSHLNFSVVSQRYVDHRNAEFVIPPLLEKHLDEPLGIERSEYGWTVKDELEAAVENAQDAYQWLEKFMEAKGYKRKEIRGSVRAVLPENTETSFVVTASIRGWRDVLEQRLDPAADIEIRLFAIEVLRELIRLAPNSVQDFAEQYANDLGESK